MMEALGRRKLSEGLEKDKKNIRRNADRCPRGEFHDEKERLRDAKSRGSLARDK